jgi:tyrosyl-tRNA synthetase
VTPQLLKSALTVHLNELLEPIRAEFDASPEWQAVNEKAYPQEKKAEKPKKIKKQGDPAKAAAAFAAAQARKAQQSGAVAQPDGHVEGKDAEKVTLGSSTEDTLKKLHIDGQK